jgi:hypothetical protein
MSDNNPLFVRLIRMFGAAPSNDPQAYIGELLKLTRGYGTAELDKAADLLIRSHNPTHLKPWPTPADICTACADAREIIAPPNPVGQRDKTWTKDAIETADKLIASKLGQRAADEGWVLSLHDFCRKQRRLPDAGEVSNLIASARDFNGAYASLVDKHALQGKLKELGSSMLDKRARLGEAAYGVV